MPFVFNFNARHMETSIQNLAERASKSASREMRKSAIKIRDLARSYAPYETGALERAIDYSTVKSANRRNVFVVHVDETRLNAKGKLVGDYFRIMEKELHPFGRKSSKRYFTLGVGSRAKAAGGKKVGGRFLARAVKDGTVDMLANARAAVTRSLSGIQFIDSDYSPESGRN